MVAGTLRIVEREVLVWRRLWRGTVFSNLVQPLLYLGAIGIGLGGLVDDSATPTLDGLDYLEFVAPGLLAASGVQLAAGDSLWPVMAGMKWIKTFHAAVAAGITPGAVMTGRLAWIALRTAGSSVPFLLFAALLGAVPSLWGVLAVPFAMLGALAFAAPLNAFAATQESDQSFSIIMRIGVLPLFLFSGTFFPVEQLPDWMEPLSVVSPLWHTAELCRASTTGRLAFGDLGHVAALVAFIVIGGWLGVRTYTRRLSP